MNKKLDELIEKFLGIKHPVLKIILKAGLCCAVLNIIYGAGRAAGEFMHFVME